MARSRALRSSVHGTPAQPYVINDNDVIIDAPDKEYVLRVKDMPDHAKPRERLIASGPEHLDIKELIAVLFQVGTRREEVMSMASRVLKEYGEKSIVTQTNPKLIEEEMGIPLAKACQLVACFELGRRFFKEGPGLPVVRTMRQVYDHVKDMANLPKEHLRGLYLNSRNQIVRDEVVAIGTLTSSIIHPREVFQPALYYTAAAVIIVHNHPSGSTKPSNMDIEVTHQLIEAGKILGVDLLDHIIITKHGYASVPAPYLHTTT